MRFGGHDDGFGAPGGVFDENRSSGKPLLRLVRRKPPGPPPGPPKQKKQNNKQNEKTKQHCLGATWSVFDEIWSIFTVFDKESEFQVNFTNSSIQRPKFKKPKFQKNCFCSNFGILDMPSCLYAVFDKESDVQVKNKEIRRTEVKKQEKRNYSY